MFQIQFERQEQDLAIGDSAGLRKSSSLFKVLGDHFLASLFHIDVVVFRKQTVSFLLHGALVYLRIFSWLGHVCALPTCSLVVTGKFYGKLHVQSVCTRLSFPHEREPGFKASFTWFCFFGVMDSNPECSPNATAMRHRSWRYYWNDLLPILSKGVLLRFIPSFRYYLHINTLQELHYWSTHVIFND